MEPSMACFSQLKGLVTEKASKSYKQIVKYGIGKKMSGI